ncbi:MAG: DUF3786 domain-containing protein [Thermodesulfobacteriota bacterium]
MELYPNTSEEGFELAYEIACKKLASMDLREVCRKSGAQYVDQNRIIVHYLNRPYLITLPDVEISLKDEDEKIPIKDRILILHYLTQATGAPYTNQLITYGQIEGRTFYCPVFVKRNLEPILSCFGDRPELLVDVAQKFGGKRTNYGDVSVSIDAFPMARIFIIIWRGDDEVPHGGNILFDGNIKNYLASEDVCVLTEILTWRLINLAKPAPRKS